MVMTALQAMVPCDGSSPFSREVHVKKALQEIAIYSLSRAGFFDKAAFHGGTSLMMFHGLNRFSEDLDFVLKSPQPDFRLDRYFSYLKNDFKAFGLDIEISSYEKVHTTDVDTAFFMGNTREVVLQFYGEEFSEQYPGTQKTKVKFKIDMNPVDYAGFEVIEKERPYLHAVTLCDLPTLFAGKIGAVLTGKWGNRVKGRDLFDFEFYVGKKIHFNIRYLGENLERMGSIDDGEKLTYEDVRRMLIEKFDEINYRSAIEDVQNFVDDREQFSKWNSEYFKSMVPEIIESGTYHIDPRPKRKYQHHHDVME